MVCRAKGEGGRRCKCMWTTDGKAKHNRRRRENRAIARNAEAWARREGFNSLADNMNGMAAQELKDVLGDIGQNPKDFIAGVPTAGHVEQTGRLGHAGVAALAAAAQQAPTPAAVRRGAPAAGAQAGAAMPAGAPGAAVPTGQPPAPNPSGPAWSTAPWCTSDLQPRVQAAMAAQGGHRDERSALTGHPDTVTQVKGGTNKTSRVQLDNGVVGYHKPFEDLNDGLAHGFGQQDAEQPLHEAAAWQLASRLGPPYSEMVPPVVIREVNGKLGSFALERPGKPMVHNFEHVPEWREAAFFDSLIGQQDRHPGNYLVAGDRLALIDHGYSFARPGDYKNWSFLVSARRKDIQRSLTYQEQLLLQKVVASPDLLGMRNLLSSDRADAMKARAERMLAKSRIVSSF